MKVIVISNGLNEGGTERVSSILASELSKRGHEVIFIATYSNVKSYSLYDKVQYKYIDVDRYGKLGKYYNRSLYILNEIKKFKPDCVFSFLVQELLIQSIFNNKNIVYSERTDPNSELRRIKILKRIVYNSSKAVVFQTKGAREYYGKKVQKKGIIIANPMDEDLPQWNIDQHEKFIVTACRISPEKNLEMLLKAFEIFKGNHNEYKLKIYGAIVDDSYYKKLMILVEEYGIREYVEFCGFSNNVHKKIIEGEVFVLTSNFEGLSNSMLEALCMGIPSICTDCPCGGAAMYIKDGINGFLVGVNDSIGLANRLRELVDNKELQRGFSLEAMRLKEELAKDGIIDCWEQILA